MELTAAIKGLEYFKNCEKIILFTDSIYLKGNCLDKSLKNNNWKNKQNKVIKNLDLWKS